MNTGGLWRDAETDAESLSGGHFEFCDQKKVAEKINFLNCASRLVNVARSQGKLKKRWFVSLEACFNVKTLRDVRHDRDGEIYGFSSRIRLAFLILVNF